MGSFIQTHRKRLAQRNSTWFSQPPVNELSVESVPQTCHAWNSEMLEKALIAK